MTKCKFVELIYDKILKLDQSQYETKIPIEVFSMLQIPLNDSHKIQIPNSNLQELLWVYKNDSDKQNEYFHPVKSIGFR